MKLEKNRSDILSEFYSAPSEALFSQSTLCHVLDCSNALAERNRWAGTGVPFVKIGRLVRYKKADILSWLNSQQNVNSTSKYQG